MIKVVVKPLLDREHLPAMLALADSRDDACSAAACYDMTDHAIFHAERCLVLQKDDLVAGIEAAYSVGGPKQHDLH
jgi:hypothetical protein